MGNETATNVHFDTPMQDITDRLESQLFGGEEEQNELEETDENEVLDDEETLPEGDDSDSDDDEGSEEDLDEETAEFDDDQSIAALLGIDDDRVTVNEEGQVVLSAIIDGEQTEVPIKDLVASHQLQGHVNNKSIALENERREFEETRNSVATELQQRVEGLTGLGKMLEEQVVGEYAKVDWDQLRVSNPAEWSAMRQQFAERAQQVQEAQTLMSEEGQRLRAEQSQQYQAQMRSHMKGQLEKMIMDNPTWVDVSVRKVEQEGMRTFLESTYEFGKDDMKNVTDHRLIRLIKDAQAFREGKKSVETKKQKKVPKFRKPGAAKASATKMAKVRTVKANKKAVKDSGGHTSAIAASIVDRM